MRAEGQSRFLPPPEVHPCEQQGLPSLCLLLALPRPPRPSSHPNAASLPPLRGGARALLGLRPGLRTPVSCFLPLSSSGGSCWTAGSLRGSPPHPGLSGWGWVPQSRASTLTTCAVLTSETGVPELGLCLQSCRWKHFKSPRPSCSLQVTVHFRIGR